SVRQPDLRHFWQPVRHDVLRRDFWLRYCFRVDARGRWELTETVIHDFDNNGTDGALPFAGLSFDSSGNLYGTTELGGTAGFGTVFELTPAGGGSWTETILHSFANTPDGSDPIGGVSIDTSTGIIYGTTEEGGDYGYGTVYKIMP